MIIGENVRLRAIEKEDLPNFVRWLNDPDVREGLSMYAPLSLEDEKSWYEENQKKPPYERTMAIEVKPDEEEDWMFVGACSLFGFDWRVRLAEIGIHIGEKRCWNQGYGTSVMRLLLRHGFETLNLNRIFLRVYSHNPRAIHVYQKVGFVEEGILRQAHFHNGDYKDVHIMSVLRSEWQGE
jgi:RimJ/RimL family protein N-acetyltransferase